jgi:hypothetical protein
MTRHMFTTANAQQNVILQKKILTKNIPQRELLFTVAQPTNYCTYLTKPLSGKRILLQ